MTSPNGQSPAASLAGTLRDPAVTVDADDRILAWNRAAETWLALAPAASGRSLRELGLHDRPGAVRLPIAPGSVGPPDGATALVVWPARTPVADTDVELQRLRAMARLAPGVTHRGRNHLAGFAAFFAMLRLDGAFMAEYGAQLIDDLEANSRKAPELLAAYADLAREREPSPIHQSLHEAVGKALQLTDDALDVRRTVDIPENLPEILADPLRLHQALVAVLVNLLDALRAARPPGARLSGTGPRGTIRITAAPAGEVGEGAAGGVPAVSLVFEDDAPVVPAGDRVHLFDRSPPPGTTLRSGLDLAVARRLIEAGGGTIDYEPGPDGGNRLAITLPTGSAPIPAHPLPDQVPATAPGRAGRLTVLVCDDEASIRTLLARIIERGHHRALVAASAGEALEILDREPVDVVMSDQRMVEMSGVELYRAASDRHPHLRGRFILMSGDPGDEDVLAFTSATGLPVLAKPFRLEDAIMMVEDLASS